MKLHRILGLAGGLGLTSSCHHAKAPTPPLAPTEGAHAEAATAAADAGTTVVRAPDLNDGDDVSEEARKWNSSAFGGPPTEFRAGTAKPRALDAKSIGKSGDGFRVEFPSHAPITTPAVYQGKVVVSGGFHSKEMYAFLVETGKPAWAIDLDDDGPSSPACEDGVCVFNTESCTAFAVDANTGAMLWSHWLGDPLMSAPAVAHGEVFTAYPTQGRAGGAKQPPPGATHAMAAFDLKTGALLWTRWIDSDVMSSPVAIGDALFASSLAGTLYKFNQKTGEILAARRARATSAPTIVGSDIFYTKRTDAPPPATATGAPPPPAVASEAIARAAVHAKPGYTVMSKRAAYLDQSVQVHSKAAGQFSSLDSANGFGGGPPASANAAVAQANIGQFSVSGLQMFQGSRVLNVKELNVNVMGDEVVCTVAETGRERWRYKLTGDLAGSGGALGAAPVGAGGSVFVGTLGGEVLRFNAETGKLEKRYAVGAPVRAQLVLDDGWMYVPTEDGKLVAIDTGERMLSGWPMWGANAARTGVVR